MKLDLFGPGQGEGSLLAIDDPCRPLPFRTDRYKELTTANVAVLASRTTGGFETDLWRERQDDGVWEEHGAVFEELGNLRNVGADLLTLEAFQTGLAPPEARDVRDLRNLVSRKKKRVDLDVLALPGAKSPDRQFLPLHWAASRSRATSPKRSLKRPCSQATPSASRKCRSIAPDRPPTVTQWARTNDLISSSV